MVTTDPSLDESVGTRPAGMASAEGSRMGLGRLLGALPIPLFIGIAAAAMLFGSKTVLEPPLLLPILNTIFLSALPLAVAYVAGMSYLRGGPRALLLLGCGALALGLGGVSAGLIIGAPGGPNANVTVYDSGVLLGALLHFVGALLMLVGVTRQTHQKRRVPRVLLPYLAIALFTASLTFAALQGVLPTFFVQDVGATLLGATVLVAAATLFAASGVFFGALYLRTRAGFLYWYCLALGLFAVGLACVLIQESVGNLLGWAGRGAQYLGGAYFLVAVLAAVREARATGTGLGRAMNGFFRRHVDRLVDERTVELAQANEKLRREISDRKRAEDAQRLHSEITANMPGGVYLVGADDGVIVYTNPKFEEIFGYEPGEMIGKHVSIVNAPTDKSPVQMARQIMDVLARDGSWQGEILNVRKDGTPFWSYAGVSRFDHPEYGTVLVSVHTDITQRKRAEEAVADLARFPAENPYPVLRIAKDGTVLYTNRPGWDLLGRGGREDRRHVPPEWGECVSRALASGSVQRTEARHEQSVFALHFAPVTEAAYVNIYGIDITQRQRLQEQLLQSQKMDAIGKLAGGVAHDFRNQLLVIKWCAERLRSRSLVNDEGLAEVQEILAAAERSSELTGQLLAFSRKDMLQPKVIDVGALILDMGKSLPAMVGEDIRLSVVLGSQPCLANLDPGQFQHAVVNLVVNARDAMPGGGELTIKVDCVDLDAGLTARHLDAQPGRHVLVSVTDVGVGMDEATLAKAFDPFFTTKDVAERTGLGLSMVYGFVKQSGGIIEVQSEPGRGSTFQLYFPCAEVTAKADRAVPAVEESPGGSETVLVVEDEASIRALLVDQLQEFGYTVLQAPNAQDSLSLVQKHSGVIDLVITDIVMPGGNGVEVARHVKRARPGIRMLYVSGYDHKELSRRGIAQGSTPLLAKPFDVAEFARAVRAALDGIKKPTRGKIHAET